ncbi:MAG: GNAT family N-acetyltransferase [Clostridiales bacterium]|nr:GNAT family N-acetyltransferase [Clostridiales bacterium]
MKNIIKQIHEKDIAECVNVIKESFLTVADEFGFTVDNAPRFTAFATTEDRLLYQLKNEHRLMFAYYDDSKIIGYYSLTLQGNNECELNNLCVIPQYRHKHIGARLLEDSYIKAKEMSCQKINIGIVEENAVLRKWYEENGFIHIGTKKFDFFPFTCGYMKRDL